MIIFDLDGTLANCENRQHFVDPNKNKNFINEVHSVEEIIAFECEEPPPKPRWVNKYTNEKFVADWRAFHDACNKDVPIWPVIYSIRHFHNSDNEVQIWSGRCESVREKTEEWLENLSVYHDVLKMRPIGDNTPDDVLKEKWLDEAIAEGKKIDFVFDDRPKVVRMWRRRGIFVFNCCQHNEEF